MSGISKDPNAAPELPDGLAEFAMQNNQQLALIVCDDRETDTISQFWVSLPYKLEVGDVLRLRDGTKCEVRRMLYEITTLAVGLTLTPNYSAVKIPAALP